MNHNKWIVLGSVVFALVNSEAHASGTYELTITNGSSMPISAGAVYAIKGQASDSEIGSAPSMGLVNLCQMGDPTLKLTELQANTNVTWFAKTPGPILPGQKITVEADVPFTPNQSLHFVAMYGKSKELCSTIDVNSRDLRTLRYGDEIIRTDAVIEAGAATEPTLPSGSTANLCQSAAGSIDCLRALTTPRTSSPQIHYFAGYLPSVINFLESKYGSDDVLTLFVPHSGAVNYSLKRK